MDMAGRYFEGRLGEVTLCNSGCELYLNSAKYQAGTKNGVFHGTMIMEGTAQFTGQKCPADSPNSSPGTKPSDVNVPPSGPGDCESGERFMPNAVNGQNVCVKGDGTPETENDFCKANPSDAKCKPGGDEYCKANPTLATCQKGSDEFCKTNPGSESCVPGGDDFCKANPGHGSCTPGTDQFCSMKPNDPSCAQKNDDACKANPNSEQCKKAKTCANNPNDPTCKPSQEGFCKSNPNDDKCKNAFTGSCESTFTCQGDPVQCAIAKEMHKRNCEMSKEPEGWSDLTKKSTTESGIAWEGAIEENDFRSKFTLQNPEQYAGSCPVRDQNVRVPGVMGFGGGSVEFKLSMICEHGTAIRMVVNALTTLSCLWIIWMWVGRRF